MSTCQVMIVDNNNDDELSGLIPMGLGEYLRTGFAFCTIGDLSHKLVNNGDNMQST